MIETRVTTAADAEVVRLAALLRTELALRYQVDVTGARPDSHSPAVIAQVDGHAVGCVILQLGAAGHAELRTMFVAPEHRGLGVSRRLLEAIEALAALEHVRTVRLETGVLQPEAMALYTRSGYLEVVCDDLLDSDTRCYEKTFPSR